MPGHTGHTSMPSEIMLMIRPHPATPHAKQEHLQELSFSFEDVCCRGDRVAVYRSASVVTRDGTHQPGIAVFDVWRVVGGQVRGGPLRAAEEDRSCLEAGACAGPSRGMPRYSAASPSLQLRLALPPCPPSLLPPDCERRAVLAAAARPRGG